MKTTTNGSTNNETQPCGHGGGNHRPPQGGHQARDQELIALALQLDALLLHFGLNRLQHQSPLLRQVGRSVGGQGHDLLQCRR